MAFRADGREGRAICYDFHNVMAIVSITGVLQRPDRVPRPAASGKRHLADGSDVPPAQRGGKKIPEFN